MFPLKIGLTFVPPLHFGDDRGGGNPALIKWLYGFDSQLVLGPVIPINDFKNGCGPCLHGSQDEVGTTKHN